MIQTFNINTTKGKQGFERFLLKQSASERDRTISETAAEICEYVRADGDNALLNLTEKFDGVRLKPGQIKVKTSELKSAEKKVSQKFKNIVKKAARNIEEFHKNQIGNSFSMSKETGGWMGEMIRPIERVGVYIPGGTAPLVSTILMTVIPAKLAGCPEIVLCTPPSSKGEILPEILATAFFLGVKDVCRIGGAQAIAALAYGTETIKSVDFIAGPGNIYVAEAKNYVSGKVGIDSIAGPTEIIIIADGRANPDYIAADLLAQSEHDSKCMSVLLTPSKSLCLNVKKKLKKQIHKLNRKKIIKESFAGHGALVVTKNMAEAVNVSNELAPEHLEIICRKPETFLDRIKNAGTIFLGEYAPVPACDYASGPNHVLPTSRTARFSSPLSVRDFQKYMNVIYMDRHSLEREADIFRTFARAEKLDGHRNAIDIRLKR